MTKRKTKAERAAAMLEWCDKIDHLLKLATAKGMPADASVMEWTKQNQHLLHDENGNFLPIPETKH